MKAKKQDFGTGFERFCVVICAMAIAMALIFLSIKGPLVMGEISFKAHPLILNQLVGQDIINIFPLSFILMLGAILLAVKKPLAKYLLISTPLFLFYYAISYAIGWDWMATEYHGNNEQYFFYYLGILIGGLIIMLYSLSVFPKNVETSFKKQWLLLYSILMLAFLIIFSSMWIKQVLEVQQMGTTKGYDIAPAAFWLVRTIDLGFCIPLGLLSVYLLWARAKESYAIQFLFYGFFVTQILAVNAMGITMYLNKDPNIKGSEVLFFLLLALLLISGFIFVVSNYKLSRK